jgi:hypothetical protein
MNSSKNTPHFLGIAFLIVLITSALGSIFLNAAIGTGGTSEVMDNILNNMTMFRISIMTELFTSIGIIVLAVLLYSVLQEQNKIISLIALMFWVAEGITLAISKLGAFSLIQLSKHYESSKSDYLNTFYEVMFNGFDRTGYGLHFLFYCLGGVLWFYLFYKSGFIPKMIALWGVIAESGSLVGSVIVLCGINVNMLYFAHIALLELAIGLWLAIKGFNNVQKISYK